MYLYILLLKYKRIKCILAQAEAFKKIKNTIFFSIKYLTINYYSIR